jgi:hypothetical protein
MFMENFIVAIFSIAGVVIVIAGLGLIIAFPIMWCWNYTMPVIFHLPLITWGQAWCLHFLAGCMIKSSHTHSK